MSKADYPSEVTEENVQQLIERARAISKTRTQKRYLIPFGLLIPVTIAIVFVIPSLILTWFLQNHYFDFVLVLPSIAWQTTVQVFLVAIILYIASYTLTFFILPSLVILSSRFMTRYFGYPSFEEVIFSECFIIAKHMNNNERAKADRRVYLLLSFLRRFAQDWFNPKRRAFSPEINILRSGEQEIRRMVWFSKEASTWLMKFGLAFVRNDNPEAFSYLRQVIKNIEEYGGAKGRLHRLMSRIEQYPTALPFILSITSLVISTILAIYLAL